MPDARAPLDGIRVLDFGRGPVSGLATMVLADYGADVLLIEPPEGDPMRAMPSSPLWLRGKRSRVLDLGSPAGRDVAWQLASEADVAVFAGTSRQAHQLGIDPERLRGLNPALIYCSVTGWGARGDYAAYPAYEALIAAKSGRMLAFAGQTQREGPSYTAVQVGTHAASQGAVHGILAALHARASTGAGALVETSLLQAMLPYDLMSVPLTQLIEREPEVFGNLPVIGGGMPTLNYHPVMAGDGRWLQCGNLLEHLFYAFLEATGLIGELLTDERFQTDAEGWGPEAIEFARDRILERLQEKDADAWMEIFRAQGNVAIEPYLTTAEALNHVDLVGNGDLVEHDHPRLGRIRQIGPIAELRATPGSAATPAPELGSTDEGWLPRGDSPAFGSGPAKPPGRPLDGTTVLELGTIIATPLGASMLADLGARVIKVEPLTGDPFREMGVGPTVGLMAYKTNAAKESICIDLKTDAGRALVQQLAQRADALIHNYRPGVPERLGIGYEQLASVNPKLVWVSANGYGPHSASARRPSAHPVPGAAMGGAIHQAAGTPDIGDGSIAELREAARQLMRANEANPDPNTSVVIASATLLGLLAQQRFGIGQPIFVNMLTANAYANYDDFLDYAGKPPRRAVDREVFGLGALYRLYRAAEGWVFLAAPREADWHRLCAALPEADWANDERFTSTALRAEHDAELASALAATFASRPADDWERDLTDAGVGCVRADGATVGEFFTRDAHAIENGFAPTAPHAQFGELRRFGPLTMVDGGADHYAAGALAGADTDALLSELGYTSEEIAALRRDRIVTG